MDLRNGELEQQETYVNHLPIALQLSVRSVPSALELSMRVGGERSARTLLAEDARTANETISVMVDRQPELETVIKISESIDIAKSFDLYKIVFGVLVFAVSAAGAAYAETKNFAVLILLELFAILFAAFVVANIYQTQSFITDFRRSSVWVGPNESIEIINLYKKVIQ